MDQDDLAVADVFLQTWTNFAKTGDPTPPGQDYTWNQFTSSTPEYLNIAGPQPFMEIGDDYSKRMEFWHLLCHVYNCYV